jgi:predicted metal-dependent phosphoesterase TrpH
VRYNLKDEDLSRHMTRIQVELHCHSYHSKDSLLPPERILQICEGRGIDKIAITDHNTIAGGLEAARLNPDRVIVGEEIMTTQGEVLGYFVQEEIPPGLTPQRTIALLREQGAFISVSHPFDTIRKGSWREQDLHQILPLVDALEICNARTMWDGPNARAAELASRMNLLGTAGSDAHAAIEVGRIVMRLPTFHNAESMRRALQDAEIIGRRSSPLVHFYSRYAKYRKALGWRPPKVPHPDD